MASLKDVERQMILQALQKTDDNRTHAAKMEDQAILQGFAQRIIAALD